MHLRNDVRSTDHFIPYEVHRIPPHPARPIFGFGVCAVHLLPEGCYCFCPACIDVRSREVGQYIAASPSPLLNAIEFAEFEISQISLMS